MENRKRSLLKAISWRMLGTLDTMIISWIITGKLVLAISIGTTELITKTLLYYTMNGCGTKSNLAEKLTKIMLFD